MQARGGLSRAAVLLVALCCVGGAAPPRAWAWDFVEVGEGANDAPGSVLGLDGGDVLSAGPIQGATREAAVLRHDGYTGAPRWRHSAIAPEGRVWSRALLARDPSGRILAAFVHWAPSNPLAAAPSTVVALLSPDTGAELWRVELPDIRLAAVAAGSAGEVFAVGDKRRPNVNRSDPFVMRLAAEDGAIAWAREMPSSGSEPAFTAVGVRPDGDLFVAGGHAPSGPVDGVVMRLRGSDGATLWHWSAGSYRNGFGVLAVDASGDVVAGSGVGSYRASIDVVRLQGDTGAVEWRTDVDDAVSQYQQSARGLVIDEGGDVFVTGTLRESTFVVLRLRGDDGTVRWRSDVPNLASPQSTNCCGGRSIAMGSDGRLIAVGVRKRSASAQEVVAVRFDPVSGAHLWISAMKLGACTETGPSLSLDPSGAVAVGAGVYGPSLAPGDSCNVSRPSYDYAVRKLRGSSGLSFYRGCGDDEDNDGDGTADHPRDLGCRSADDPTELSDCEDGLDNDGDGATDYPDDVSCYFESAPSEDAICSNGLDDDGDGAVDLDDIDCLGRPWGISERPLACGLGVELALVLPVLLLVRRALRIRRPGSSRL